MFARHYLHTTSPRRRSVLSHPRLTVPCGIALLLGSLAFAGRACAAEADVTGLLIDAAVHLTSGANAEAEKCYRSALEITGDRRPISLKITLALAAAVEKQENRKSDGARILLKALAAHRSRLGDDQPVIRQMLQMAIRMCNELAWTSAIEPDGSPEDYELAAEFAQHGVDLKLDNSFTWLLALAKLRQGKAKASLETMQRSLADRDEDWIGQWFVMAMVQLANGNRQAALDWYVAGSEWMAQSFNTWAPNVQLQAQAATQLGLEPVWPLEDWPVAKQLESLNRLVDGNPQVMPLLATRALVNVKAENWDAGRSDIKSAIDHLTRMIADKPDDRGLRTQRGDMRARLGQWKEAKDDLEAGLDPESAESLAWLHIGPVWVLTGDREGYVRFCRQLIERFRDSTVNNDFERTIKVCVLIPGAIALSDLRVQDLERAMKGEGVEPWNLGWGWGCLGLVEVRRGNPETALDCIQRAVEQPDYADAPFEQALCLLVKTLALQDLKRIDEAREAYAEALKRFDFRLACEHDVLIAELLRREAKARFK